MTSHTARAFIESVQPFEAQKQGISPDRDLLWVLQELSNIDKHRILHLCQQLAAAMKMSSPGLQVRGMKILNPRVLKDGAELARWTLAPDSPSDVKVNYEIFFDIVLDEAGLTLGTDVEELLTLLIGHVGFVLERLSGEF